MNRRCRSCFAELSNPHEQRCPESGVYVGGHQVYRRPSPWERGDQETVTIPRPMWVAGPPVSADEVREAIRWMDGEGLRNGLTQRPVFHVLGLVAAALDEKEASER